MILRSTRTTQSSSSAASDVYKVQGLDAEQWLCLTTEFEKHFCYAAAAEQMMNNFKRHINHQRMRGMG